MPVPLIVKFGFKIVLMPKLCQQLGIFSNQDSVYINNLFYNYLTKNYIVLFYAFNGNNEVSNIGLKKSNSFQALSRKPLKALRSTTKSTMARAIPIGCLASRLAFLAAFFRSAMCMTRFRPGVFTRAHWPPTRRWA